MSVLVARTRFDVIRSQLDSNIVTHSGQTKVEIFSASLIGVSSGAVGLTVNLSKCPSNPSNMLDTVVAYRIMYCRVTITCH